MNQNHVVSINMNNLKTQLYDVVAFMHGIRVTCQGSFIPSLRMIDVTST